MTESTFNPEDMPILNLNTSGTSRFEASRFLDSPEVMAAYLAESMKDGDVALVHALAEVAKAKGVNKVAEAAGVNRESLYKVFKGGARTRFGTISKLINAIGLELTVQPITAQGTAPKVRKTPPAKGVIASSAVRVTGKRVAKRAATKPQASKPAAKNNDLAVSTA